MFLPMYHAALIIEYFRMESDEELPDLPYTPQYRKPRLGTGAEAEVPDWARSRSRSRSRGREDNESSVCSKSEQVGKSLLFF